MHIAPMTLALGQYQTAVTAKIQDFNAADFTARFWQQDATLWTEDAAAQHSIRSFMGWLRVADALAAAVPEIEQFGAEVRAAGFRHVVVMGMGGSTMAPIVFEKSFARGPLGLPMTILDTTNPGTVRAVEAAVPLADTLFIVASKSGTTAEPLAFGDYFYARMREIKGDKAGENFVAITDPGSKFIAAAEAQGYRHVFLNFTEVGGRFSALSYFGMVPAALYGLNIGELLARAQRMMQACGSEGATADNPGLDLGTALGVLAQSGRDKLTLVVPPALADLGLWLEQLVAESTGKAGVGILPVAGEPLADPAVYGPDQVFVYVGYEGPGRPGEPAAAGGAASRRAPAHHHYAGRCVGFGGGVFSLGSGHGRGQRRAAHQPLRPAQRAGRQNRHRCPDARSGRARRVADPNAGASGRRAEVFRGAGRGGRGAAAAAVFRPGPARRLRFHPGLPHRNGRAQHGLHRPAPPAASPAACGHHLRLRPAFPAFPPASTTRAGRTPACFSNSPPTTPRTCRCLAAATPSAPCKAPRPRAIWKPCRATTGAPLRVHLGADAAQGLRRLMQTLG